MTLELRKKATVTFSIILLAYIFSAFIYTSYQYSKIGNIRQNWKQFLVEVDSKQELISNLKDAIGYGGMIHNLKNYLLSGDREPFLLASENIVTSFHILSQLKANSSLSKVEKIQLGYIENTIKSYQKGLDELLSISPLKTGTKDYQIRVDDKETVKAFAWFKENLRYEKDKIVSQLGDDVSTAQNTIVFSVLITSFFFLIILYLFKRVIDKTQSSLEAERQSRTHVARLSAIGQMSGSIAHEINNPLAILSGTSQMINMCVHKDPIPKDILISSANTINDTVDRISDIVSGLRNLTRDDHKQKFLSIDFDSLLSEILSLCKDRYSRYGINVITPVQTGYTIEGQRIQIAQVLINLLNNSVDAIKEAKIKWIKVEVSQNKKETTIAVIDSGCGISNNIKKKLMNPFFTTNKCGERVGVGLSISKNIIEKHCGKFFLDEASETTKFVIQLPKRKV